MANHLKCDSCGKSATVHYTQIINNKVHKVDLCEACAQAKGVTDPSGFSLSDLLLNPDLNTAANVPAGQACPQCGFTQPDFKKHGRFGCPKCYEIFHPVIDPMLDSMHKGTKHTGKIPSRASQTEQLRERLAELESNLGHAIKSERYEEAARYRDEINQVKQAIGV